MIDPLFWLGLSILLVAVSLTAVLMVAIPAFQELGRAARSAEKLFDTLSRELPPTLEAIRLTGLEISDLTDDVSQGVQSAGQVAKQVDQSLADAKQQAQKVQTTTRSVFVGFKAAWRTLTNPEPPARGRRLNDADGVRKRLSSGARSPLEPNSQRADSLRKSQYLGQVADDSTNGLKSESQLREPPVDAKEANWHHAPAPINPLPVPPESSKPESRSETEYTQWSDGED